MSLFPNLTQRSESAHVYRRCRFRICCNLPQLQDLLLKADAVLEEEDKRIEETLAKRLQELWRGLKRPHQEVTSS